MAFELCKLLVARWPGAGRWMASVAAPRLALTRLSRMEWVTSKDWLLRGSWWAGDFMVNGNSIGRAIDEWSRPSFAPFPVQPLPAAWIPRACASTESACLPHCLWLSAVPPLPGLLVINSYFVWCFVATFRYRAL